MTVEQKVLKPYLIKLVIWALLVAVLGTVCYFYHSQMDARFPPAVSISLIITVCAIVLYVWGFKSYCLIVPVRVK